ncbi:hypothetical protein GJ496_003648 [Pomphorhynchus laevis]|nr:hypothetical protein GJ496_003648 [Pomphorhynchus laevis]
MVVRNVIDDCNPNMTFSDISIVKNDLKTMFENYAPVRDIRVFPTTGVITVALSTPAEADKCLQYTNDRLWKNGKTMMVSIWDGKTKFDKIDRESIQTDDDQDRIHKWHKFITCDDSCDV